MTEATELNPCPFCGNDGAGPIEDALHVSHTQINWHPAYDCYSVQCDKCSATMGYSASEAEARAAWNIRPLTPSAVATEVEVTQADVINLEELPEQIEALRNHASERRRKGWLRSAENLDASAYLIETLAAECARHRVRALTQAGASLTAAQKAGPVVRYRHVKRGTVYEVVGEAELQIANTRYTPNEGDVLIVYRGEDGKLWCREKDEFHDGRFAAIAQAQEPSNER